MASERTVTVTSFPPGAKGWITGTFDVTIGDSPNPDVVRHLYRITGDFRLNNSQ